MKRIQRHSGCAARLAAQQVRNKSHICFYKTKHLTAVLRQLGTGANWGFVYLESATSSPVFVRPKPHQSILDALVRNTVMLAPDLKAVAQWQPPAPEVSPTPVVGAAFDKTVEDEHLKAGKFGETGPLPPVGSVAAPSPTTFDMATKNSTLQAQVDCLTTQRDATRWKFDKLRAERRGRIQRLKKEVEQLKRRAVSRPGSPHPVLRCATRLTHKHTWVPDHVALTLRRLANRAMERLKETNKKNNALRTKVHKLEEDAKLIYAAVETWRARAKGNTYSEQKAVEVEVFRASPWKLDGTIYHVSTSFVNASRRVLGPQVKTVFGNGSASPFIEEDPKPVWVTELEGRDYIIPKSDPDFLPRIVLHPIEES